VIDEILPAPVASAWTTEECIEVPLYDEELLALGDAVDKRRREFVTGRACARQALARLGFHPCSVPGGPGGAPVWPQGVVGSITHCRGYVACAVASREMLGAVGIDAEPHEPLNGEILPEIVTPAENRRLTDLSAAWPDVHWDRVWFSAKEAVYKAWFPLTGRWLGFHDAEVTLDGTTGRFVAQLLVPGARINDESIGSFSGRWLVRHSLALTAVVVPLTSADDLSVEAHRRPGRQLTGFAHSTGHKIG
jgi:enterobactin synthetase component D / holo-[acyl-carrier protein] synthase